MRPPQLGLWLLLVGHVFGGCYPADGFEDALRRADAVFAGRVVRVRPKHPDSSAPVGLSSVPVIVEFDVSRVWKGERSKVTAVNATLNDRTGGAPYTVIVGRQYLVYALRMRDPKTLEKTGELHLGSQCSFRLLDLAAAETRREMDKLDGSLPRGSGAEKMHR
jgi:hypothetical protein